MPRLTTPRDCQKIQLMLPDEPQSQSEPILEELPPEILAGEELQEPDYGLLPAEPEVERYSAPRTRGWFPPEPEPGDRELRQFTLGHLLILVTVAALILAPINWLALPTFAGLLGIFSLAGLAVINIFHIRHLIVHVSWWCLFAIYITVGILASAGY